MTKLGAFDLARVEVLKGPQGTLFGENATGGAVNYIAAKPTEAVSGGIDVSYGNFNRTQVGGFVAGPINDQLGFRVALQDRQGGGPLGNGQDRDARLDYPTLLESNLLDGVTQHRHVVE